MSAEERRESVIRAAMHEFARGGYYGTSTETIAKRVGVSQPYLFRLFPNKQAIFVAAVARCTEDIRLVFEEAAEGRTSEEAHLAMGDAYLKLIAEHPDKLQMQLQASLTVAAAEAAGETEFGEMVRAGFDEAVGHRPPRARGRRRRDHRLHGARDAHQHPRRPRLPARPPGLGRVLPRGQGPDLVGVGQRPGRGSGWAANLVSDN